MDCWDTILVNNEAWDREFIRAAAECFGTIDATISPSMVASAFRLESALFTDTLSTKLSTTPLVMRLVNLARLSGLGTERLELNGLRGAFESTILKPVPEMIPGAREFLSRAKKAGIKLCLISNTGWFSARAIDKALANHRIAHFFDFTAYSDEIGAAKPSPKIFEAAMRGIGCRPDAAVHIGDDLKKDVEGALNAGLGAIHFHPGEKCLAGDHFCASDFGEVWDIIVRHQVRDLKLGERASRK